MYLVSILNLTVSFKRFFITVLFSGESRNRLSAGEDAVQSDGITPLICHLYIVWIENFKHKTKYLLHFQDIELFQSVLPLSNYVEIWYLENFDKKIIPSKNGCIAEEKRHHAWKSIIPTGFSLAHASCLFTCISNRLDNRAQLVFYMQDKTELTNHALK